MRRLTLSVSREGRDTLWLLGMLTLAMLPHMGRLPIWCAVSAVTALLWRAQVAWGDGRLPPRWVLLIGLAASVGLTLSSHHALFGREAGVTLVVVLSGLKTLELRARRDAFVVTSLAFFLILTQFLYSQSIGLAVLMALAVWGLLTALVLAQRPLGRPPLVDAARESGRTLLLGAPLMVILFLLFPRIGPLWALPSDAQARSGLSDSLRLGHVAELAMDDSIAMHVRFDGPVPPPASLYFRGPVLDIFDGQTWVSRADRGGGDSEDLVDVNGPVVRYQITLEATHSKVLPLLEATLKAQPPSQQNALQLNRQGLDWTTPNKLHERVQLDAQAWTQFRHGSTQVSAALSEWLQLPAGYNPRTLAWAAALKRQPALADASADDLAQAVMRYIRQENFHYTLAPGGDELAQGQPAQPHQIDYFWMDRRTGFCEHFATAFVVVMRAMGVPSRVVTGYQGAELNPVDGLYIVRNSHAHAWAEYWQRGKGWVRADPTAAIAPERIDRGRPITRSGNSLPGPLSQFDSSWWPQGKAFWEATNHRWNVWVLQYSRGRQTNLLRNLGWDVADWGDIARALAMAFSAISLAGVSWLWLTRERTPQSPWRGLMWRVHRALQGAGLPPPRNCPAPAAALNWISALQSAGTSADVRQRQLADQLVSALQELDTLHYGPPAADAPDARHARTAMRALIKRAQPLVRSIEEGARRWRNLRAQTRHQAH
ncbi:MAG: DUF3488 domain-containing transglutaminase family protein [Burkholderiales bacterium]|nr:DUF3488 domain-containing transglutaminase family protein [Burkholderiales bacterium]